MPFDDFVKHQKYLGDLGVLVVQLNSCTGTV